MWTWRSDELDGEVVNVWKEEDKDKIDESPTNLQPHW